MTERSEISSCFTKAYGSHHVFGSGALVDPSSTNDKYEFDAPSTLVDLKLRFFSPWEVAILHGVPIPLNEYNNQKESIPSWQSTEGTFLKFPKEMTNIQRYRLLGNSLNPIVVAKLMDLIFYS